MFSLHHHRPARRGRGNLSLSATAGQFWTAERSGAALADDVRAGGHRELNGATVLDPHLRRARNTRCSAGRSPASASGFGQEGRFQVAAGPEWERGYWLLDAQANFGGGTQDHRGLTTRERWLGLTASALVGVRVGNVSLRAGPALGAHAVSQSPESPSSRRSGVLRTGARVRVDVELTNDMSLILLGEAQVAFAPVDGADRAVAAIGSWGATTWLGYCAGIAAVW